MSPSKHMAAEVAAAWWRGRKEGRPVPLDPGEPVPGCPCELCTDIPESAPVRARRQAKQPSDRPALNVAAARVVPILEVGEMLGIAHKNGWARCPFHADHSPSLHLNSKKNVAFCNPCDRSWDGIALVMELRGVDFVEAVRLLAP